MPAQFNEHTRAVARVANTDREFFFEDRPGLVELARSGDVDAAAERLRHLVADEGRMASDLPPWVDFSCVDWTEIASRLARG